ncbi:sensor domain-containing diguanylate cyclase [Novosphingobium sp. ZN18A2]|uniref:GGDEF domain-containing protein n=1 Tax=Novosphingobium sp. ZN18A2 TaxID=3079861 RepID=UPI0030D3268C
MDVRVTPQESTALYMLLKDSTQDIIVRTDRDGAILDASPVVERFGLPSAGELAGRKLVDLAAPDWADVVGEKLAAAMSGRNDTNWTEFAARTRAGGECWFELQLRGVPEEGGAVGIMRSIDERRHFERALFNASMTDPLTGLTNRRAFISMLEHLCDEGGSGCLAMFDVDHFKSINLRYGFGVGDEVLVAVADLVRTLTRSRDIISRIGGPRIGILLPGASMAEAQAICGRIVGTLSEIRQSAGSNAFSVTASAGAAPIAATVDDTIKRAELALAMAKARGRNRLEMDRGGALPWSKTPATG